MRYYSDTLKKLFETEEELKKAEVEFEEKHALELKKKEERAHRAKEVEEAYKKYLDLRSKFVKDYGSYHMTITENDLKDLSVNSLFDFLNF